MKVCTFFGFLVEPIVTLWFFSIGVGGDLVGFNKEGDSFGKYDIFQYQQTSKGVFKYVHIGDWIDRLSTIKMEWIIKMF